MFVRTRMTENVVTIGPKRSLYEALILFEKNHYEGLPVLEGGVLKGIITERVIMREFCAFCAKQNITAGVDLDLPLPFSTSKLELDVNKRRIAQFLHFRTVEELMEKDIVTVDKEAPIEEAAELMLKNSINILPAVNDIGELKGVITKTDILEVFDEIFALSEKGERITLAVDDDLGSLGNITGVLKNAKINIISAVTTMPRYRDVYLVILKVEEGERAKKVLEKHQYKVLSSQYL
ncbi:CBS domain-containing protein [Proteinivorax tanatarense]|uniref:CBS domain-containing protein n=1 Tax=Proteinivorax tanatarense TaxID=1260629 RepID=A0AAU7VIZ4_9FIRM